MYYIIVYAIKVCEFGESVNARVSRICGWNLLAGGGVQLKALMRHAPEDTDKGGQTQLQMAQ